MFLKTDKLRSGLYLLMAFITALMLWYTVNAKEQVERVVEVRLDYKGLPSGFVVTSGQLNRISVRLRGPLELLRSLTGRELSYTLDLSTMTKGSNVIPLVWNYLPDLRAYQVVEVMPPRLVLEVDHILESRVPVVVRFRESPLTPSLNLEDVQVQPEHVVVRGPAVDVSKIKRVIVELPVDLNNEGQTATDDVPVVAPPSVEVVPATVKVKSTVTVQRRNMSLLRDLTPPWADADMVKVEPARVNLVVSVPRSAISDVSYMAQIQTTLPNQLPPAGTQKPMPVKVLLPQGARIISLNPEYVLVTNGTLQEVDKPLEEGGKSSDPPAVPNRSTEKIAPSAELGKSTDKTGDRQKKP